MLRTDDFDYALPEELIASRPLARRDASRMMVVNRAEGTITHRHFADFPTFQREGDLVALNNTRVVPSRFFSDDGKIEIVRLDGASPLVWKCLVRPGKKMRLGATTTLGGITAEVTGILEGGERIIRFEREIDIAKLGHLALPHYMKREDEAFDRERYQTVYAREDGAIAAPTAGLHFTPELVASLPHTFITLHVGVGTFAPVKADLVTKHRMHSERFAVSPEAADDLNAAARIVAVGTTVTRVLEHLHATHGRIVPGAGETDIFLYPPHQLKAIGALLTNFHLPKSTLLMLVSAFAGSDLIREAYRQAVSEKYRFFSYGDCMLVL
jgi:S-adenosylmethionine:tRNA ribosyltransferase-isomerase